MLFLLFFSFLLRLPSTPGKSMGNFPRHCFFFSARTDRWVTFHMVSPLFTPKLDELNGRRDKRGPLRFSLFFLSTRTWGLQFGPPSSSFFSFFFSPSPPLRGAFSQGEQTGLLPFREPDSPLFFFFPVRGLTDGGRPPPPRLSPSFAGKPTGRGFSFFPFLPFRSGTFLSLPWAWRRLDLPFFFPSLGRALFGATNHAFPPLFLFFGRRRVWGLSFFSPYTLHPVSRTNPSFPLPSPPLNGCRSRRPVFALLV